MSIKNSTRKKLREAAIRNNFGYYKIYDRKYYSDEEINRLIISYYENKNKLVDLFDKNKIHSTIKLWRNSVIRRLDKDSCNRFFFKLEENIPVCKYCKNTLSIKEYLYKGGKDRFGKYCMDCIKNRNHCRYKHSDESIKKFSISKSLWAKSKDGLKFYKRLGKHNSINLKKFFKTKKGIKQLKSNAKILSKILKEKIKLGTFTPNITNSWTHWDAIVTLGGKLRKFRSSWEACFFISNPSLSYEKIRIPYEIKGKQKTYISDFYDEKNHILYEIKPKSIFEKQQYKIQKVIKYCLDNNIKFVWVNENNIMKYIDKKKFTEDNLSQYNKMIKGVNSKK